MKEMLLEQVLLLPHTHSAFSMVRSSCPSPLHVTPSQPSQPLSYKWSTHGMSDETSAAKTRLALEPGSIDATSLPPQISSQLRSPPKSPELTVMAYRAAGARGGSGGGCGTGGRRG